MNEQYWKLLAIVSQGNTHTCRAGSIYYIWDSADSLSHFLFCVVFVVYAVILLGSFAIPTTADAWLEADDSSDEDCSSDDSWRQVECVSVLWNFIF